MEYIQKSQARQLTNGAVTSREYAMQNATLNVAPITIRGRYPASGFTSNLQSDAIVHVVGGHGTLGLRDGTSVTLTKDDQLHLAVGDSYYFEGELDILYSASPAWTPEQTEQSE